MGNLRSWTGYLAAGSVGGIAPALLMLSTGIIGLFLLHVAAMLAP